MIGLNKVVDAILNLIQSFITLLFLYVIISLGIIVLMAPAYIAIYVLTR